MEELVLPHPHKVEGDRWMQLWMVLTPALADQVRDKQGTEEDIQKIIDQ